MKQHTTGVAKVVNPLGTVVTVQSDDDYEVEAPEDVVIHENCDEALFRPVVASKALVFSEPKIITNSLPVTQTAIVESPLPSGKSSYHNKLIANLSNKKSSSANCNNKPATKPTKKLDKNKSLQQNEAIKLKSTVSKRSNNDDSDPESKPTPINAPKTQICAFSDPFDDLSVKKSDCLIECDYSLDKDSQSQACSENKIDSETLLLETDNTTSTWKDMTYEYTFEEPEIQTPKDVLDTAKLKSDKYQGLDAKEILQAEEKQYAKRVRKPKPKLGVRLTKGNNDAFDVVKSDDEPVENNLRTNKTWSSVAAIKPPKEAKEDLIFYDEIEKPVDSSDPEPSLEPENISDVNLLKIYKSDDEKQENGSHSETTESDDSSKVAQLIAMDTEEDAYQAESVKNNDQAVAAKGNGKKKPKKKRR